MRLTDSGAEVSSKSGQEEGVHQKAIGSRSESDMCDVVRIYREMYTEVETSGAQNIKSITMLLRCKYDSLFICTCEKQTNKTPHRCKLSVQCQNIKMRV